RLLRSSATRARAPVEPCPVAGPGVVDEGPPFRLSAGRLEHGVEAFGWRLKEPDGRRMIPEKLAVLGIAGPDIGRLQRSGSIEAGGRRVSIEQVSEVRPGQSFAFVMDTRICDAAFELAAGVDMLVCESTFLSEEAALAEQYGHLTAAHAATIARDAGARLLVLTHFSQRYPDTAPLLEEAQSLFPNTVAAADLVTIPVPPRH
ncbi:MAG TPA: ribonuclease Z, partial [Actinomycetota bacterium]|nr:ribonuclease Z [Actinomycetota bacterium]